MVITDRYLRDYALKIYKNVPGYTFEKVFTLFPKYAGVIMSYYEDFKSEEQNKKVNQLGIYVSADFLIQFKQVIAQHQTQKEFIQAAYNKEHAEITDLFNNYESHIKDLTPQQRETISKGLVYNYKSLTLERLYKDCVSDLTTMSTMMSMANTAAPLMGTDIADTIFSSARDIFKADITVNLDAIQAFKDKSDDVKLQSEATTYVANLSQIIDTLPKKTY